MKDFPTSGIYCITDFNHSGGKTNIDVVKEMAEANVKIIQYREKHKSMKEKYEECLEIIKITKAYDIVFIVNDHIDLALAVDADGVHIGQDDMPVHVVRNILGPDKIIGLSTHSPAQAKAAENSEAVDYIGAGPVFQTNTKEDVCDPVGLEYIEYVSKNINLPFVAIGGIKEHNINLVKEKGASWFALVTEITGALNIGQKISDLEKIIA